MTSAMLMLTNFSGWRSIDTQIALVAALCAAACAVLGVFLVLRKMSMMGDAISHAVLPGLAAAFLVTGQRDSLTMFVGAAVVGLLTAVLIEWVHRRGEVEAGAAMGVVFTCLFAVGLVLLRAAADKVDLDPNCVLFGAIELTPLDGVRVAGWVVPRAAIPLAIVLSLNLAFVVLFYKELKLSTFDPALATSLGFDARIMQYALMTLTAVTAVAAFESVGSVLVVAMLIVPAATAQLLTDRLSGMLIWSVVLALAAAVGGHAAALAVPGWLGWSGRSASTAGMISVVGGVLFLAAWVFAPRYGLLRRAWQRFAISRETALEDALLLLLRGEERQAPVALQAMHDHLRSMSFSPLVRWWTSRSLKIEGWASLGENGLRLTPRGRTRAAELLRAHRLWETFFDREVHLPQDHVHGPADRLEHVSDDALREKLAAELDHPTADPHGRPIGAP